MSSDSEDDCYGNTAQKLQSLKNRYEEDEIRTCKLESSLPEPSSEEANKIINITDTIPSNVSEELKDDSDCDEISLDTIIAQNTKKRTTRKGKRIFNNSDISTDNIITTRSMKKSRVSATASIDLDSSQNVNDLSVEETRNETANTTRRRGRGRSRGRKGKTTTNTSTANVTTANTTNTTNTSAVSTNSSISSLNTSRARSRGRRGRRGRGRQSSQRNPQIILPEFLSSMFGFGGHSYPTYSVGNTDEYPDECYNQPLFKEQPKKDDVIVVGENELELNDTDENEELSVKVYWQSRECVKFPLRRFQKLQSIFDYFSNRESVSHDKLFFTYNDKILKIDDTPDSITYNIAKFIDGGIVHQSVSNIVHNDTTVKEGIRLKFQCQNVKKPYEIFVLPKDKLAAAMMKCAEHLEKPLEKLKFLFDGDLISGKNTPKELDLEGGECIDVKIMS